jgi:hypothetical protein
VLPVGVLNLLRAVVKLRKTISHSPPKKPAFLPTSDDRVGEPRLSRADILKLAVQCRARHLAVRRG